MMQKRKDILHIDRESVIVTCQPKTPTLSCVLVQVGIRGPHTLPITFFLFDLTTFPCVPIFTFFYYQAQGTQCL